jgi:phage FluMu protein Com
VIKFRLISPSKDNECRCSGCNKLLAKIKQVDNLAVIEIKCTKTTCRTMNVFRIEKNLKYEHSERDKDESS